MAATFTTAWDIYAEQLFSLGYGHPLWIPEPNEREVELGDVGWIKEGEVRTLFNSMKSDSDAVNRKGVPVNFALFNPPNLSIGECDRIKQKVLCGRNVRALDGNAKIGAGRSVFLMLVIVDDASSYFVVERLKSDYNLYANLLLM